MHMVPEPFATIPSPTMVNETSCNDMTPTSHPTFHPNPNALLRDSHAASDPPRVVWSSSSDGQPPLSLVKSGIPNPGRCLDEPNNNRPLPCSLPVMYSHFLGVPNDWGVAESFIPHRLPLHQSFSPSHRFPHHQRSTESFAPDPRFRFVPPQDSTASSRRRGGARAIVYGGGLWLDEQELLMDLMEADGKLNVFQCRWEENRSPCHLWIKGDKSCISTHIQRWHGVKPGGEKLEVECRWSGCGAKMLKESIARHLVSKHLGEMWECLGCGKEAARYDVHRRHTLRSDLEACRTSGALIAYSADVRVIDARAVLDGGGGLRYAGA